MLFLYLSWISSSFNPSLCSSAQEIAHSDSKSTTGISSLSRTSMEVEVSVIETVDGWSLIELQGHRGYVKEIDLRFTARV